MTGDEALDPQLAALIVISLLNAVLNGWLAKRRGASFATWSIFAFFLGFIALPINLVLAFLSKKPGARMAGGTVIGSVALVIFVLFEIIPLFEVPGCSNTATIDLVRKVLEQNNNSAIKVSSIDLVTTVKSTATGRGHMCSATYSGTENGAAIKDRRIAYTVTLTDSGDQFYVSIP